jgi:hypothetical protein
MLHAIALAAASGTGAQEESIAAPLMRPLEFSGTITGFDDLAVWFTAGVHPHHSHRLQELISERSPSCPLLDTEATAKPLSDGLTTCTPGADPL